ncbi:MAG: sugar phosphate isomerase/epimerase, partial [Verrucomicrobia bacterium]|nr:sugar phosphate isomerase/epimerase [Verrucomicrobiota bacterium]
RIAHAKDVKRSSGDTAEKHAEMDASEAHTFRGVGAIELPAPGLGDLNYNLYLQRLSRKHPNIPIVIEHLEEADVPRAKRFLDDKLRNNGL